MISKNSWLINETIGPNITTNLSQQNIEKAGIFKFHMQLILNISEV